MGQWTMHIEGHGVHDNGRQDDAEVMLKKFVEELMKFQTVYSSTFTVGSSRELVSEADDIKWKYLPQ